MCIFSKINPNKMRTNELRAVMKHDSLVFLVIFLGSQVKDYTQFTNTVGATEANYISLQGRVPTKG